MNRLKGLLFLLAAIGAGVFLVVGWDFLGEYFITLRFLPDVPLLGGRLFVGLVAVAMAISATESLRGKRESAEAPAQPATTNPDSSQ